MNERNYFILETFCLFIAIFYLLFGLYLLAVFEINNMFYILIPFFTFIVFIFLSWYFLYRRFKFVKEMEEEINKLKAGFNGKNNRP